VTAIMITIRAERADVTFRYDPAVVDLIKTIPSHLRSWDTQRKTWTIPASTVPSFVRMLEDDGHRVHIEGDAYIPPPRTPTAGGTWADDLLDAVGPQRVEPVHRALARVLHPDVGGDTMLMQALNAARDRRVVRR